MTTFRALTTSVSVDVDETTHLAEVARALVAPYPQTRDTVELRYELRGAQLWRNGAQIVVDDPHDVVPAFELDLYNEVVARAAPGWLLHAAALEIGGKALVLCGPSGAGKTTLALALSARGYRLLTEEVVWLDASASVRGLPRAMHVRTRSEQHARIPASWDRVPYPLRDRTGELRDHTLVVPAPEAITHDTHPLLAIVHMEHGPDRPVHLETSPQATALVHLWDQSLRRDDGGLAVATRVLRHHPTYTLSSTTVDEALARLDVFLK